MLHQNEMRNIGTVIAVAVLDKDFGPDEVGHGRDLYFVVEKFCRFRILEPVIGDWRHEIGRTEDEVDVKLAFEDFRDPALVGNLILVSQRCELVKDFGIVTRLAKDVDVFRRTSQTGVGIDSKSSGYHKSEFRVFEDLQDFRIERMSPGGRISLHYLSILKVTRNPNPGIYRSAEARTEDIGKSFLYFSTLCWISFRMAASTSGFLARRSAAFRTEALKKISKR